MEEIIEHVFHEIKNSGYDQKLSCGIVVTGGGAQLKHITQLYEFITGLDSRVGLPTEHLASTNTIENLTSPIYSTGIGLVIKGFESNKKKLTENIDKKVKQHSDEEIEKKGPFFKKILKQAQDFFTEKD